MRRLWFILLLLAGAACAAEKSAPAPLLPERFAGWEKSAGSAKASQDAGVADPANAMVLQEFGFTEFESATYTRPGRTLKLKAIRLRDHSSAYGAFVFYKTPEMLTEQIGDQAASWNEHLVFYRGDVLVDAVFDRATAMSLAELRELADALPVQKQPQGQPPIIEYFPRQAYVRNTVKYVLGPAGLNAIAAPVGAELVDFSKSPEVATGRYRTSAGEATLTLIYYPTPQIAGERLRAIESALNATPEARSESDNFAAKRTGPIVAVMTGAVPNSEAKSLLASISYDADVTWNEATKLGPRDNALGLLVAAIKLSAILVSIMLGLGLLYGLGRYAMRRYMPGYVRDSGEMIRLDLDPATARLVEGEQPRLPASPGK
ncbi:MAG TPA: DUF6599 family protein [Terriglobales bacterium]|nr:DUF6599 family protein [Terriglobales bacterium]